MLNRREAVKGIGVGIAAASVSRQLPAGAAHDRIVVGVAGCGGRGRAHARFLAQREDVRVAYVCDPDLHRVKQAAAEVEQVCGKKPAAVQDFRRILDDAAVDAIVIATPDHWHAPATVLACEAGKHVYVEKPCSHNVREGRLMITAARKHDRVVQVGTQARHSEHVKRAVQLMREGAIGEVLVAKAWNSQRRGGIGRGKPGAPPSHLDYDLWLGPAPHTPYHSNRLHYNWHWRYAFGTGDMGNDGVHEIDLALWGLGVASHPTLVGGVGEKLFFEDDQQFPDTQNIVCQFAPEGGQKRGKQLVFEMRLWAPYRSEGYENGNAFYGTEGFLLLGKNDGFQLFGKRNQLLEKAEAAGANAENTRVHHADFLRCIRAGKRPEADIEVGHRAAAVCHLGNICARVGRSLRFDPVKEQIDGDAEANGLLSRSYRENHWASLS